jgi:hypothetical protein
MSKKLVGKLVYTINAKTILVDSWRCTDVFKGLNNETMYELRDGAKLAILPRRCVYVTFEKALEVAKRK